MRFNLVENHYIPFLYGKEEFHRAPTWEGEVQPGIGLVQGDVIPLYDTGIEQQRCYKLKQLLTQLCRPNDNSIWNLMVTVGVSKIPNMCGTYPGYLQLSDEYPGGCLHAIQELSDNDATIQIACKQMLDDDDSQCIVECKLITSEIKLFNDNGTRCIDSTIHFPTDKFGNLGGYVTISVTLPDSVLDDGAQSGHPAKPLPQKILEQEIFSDVTIICARETVIKAHKCFLASQSSVFYSKFSSDATFKRECKINMEDMSEGSVRAFLRYLYYEDASIKKGDMRQTFELYTAAKKYRVGKLEKYMRETILGKPDDWFDLDGTLKLFMVARASKPVDKELEVKAVGVLKTARFRVKESPVYQQLFETDMAAAMELCELALE